MLWAVCDYYEYCGTFYERGQQQRDLRTISIRLSTLYGEYTRYDSEGTIRVMIISHTN